MFLDSVWFGDFLCRVWNMRIARCRKWPKFALLSPFFTFQVSDFPGGWPVCWTIPTAGAFGVWSFVNSSKLVGSTPGTLPSAEPPIPAASAPVEPEGDSLDVGNLVTTHRYYINELVIVGILERNVQLEPKPWRILDFVAKTMVLCNV